MNITLYTIEIQSYFNVIKVYCCMTELIFNVKCSCSDVQILREKVEFWGGCYNFGSNNKGLATKIEPLFVGGVKKMIYIDVEKLPPPPPLLLLNNEWSLTCQLDVNGTSEVD